jgi:serine/threonine protein phosphatase PrpC
LNDTGQLSTSLVHAIAIDRVNDEDQALGAREVVSPQRTDLVLTADIPDVEFGVLVCDGLDVEADRGDCCDILV